MLEIASVSIALAIKSLWSVSLYVTLGIFITFTIIKLILYPYNNSIDNARLYVHQLLLIILNSLQIGFKFLKDSEN